MSTFEVCYVFIRTVQQHCCDVLLQYIYTLFTQEGARYNNDIALLRSSPEEELRFARRCTRASIWPACFPSPDIDYSFWFDTWVRDITSHGMA